MSIKLIFVLLILLLIPWFHSRDFKVIDTEMQTFDSGRRESGSGINYRIRLVVNKKSSLVQFRGIWLNGKMYAPDINGKASSCFSKGDTLLLTFTVWLSGSEHAGVKIGDKDDSQVLPVGFKEKNVIEWEKRGKIHYKELPEFVKLPSRVNR